MKYRRGQIYERIFVNTTRKLEIRVTESSNANLIGKVIYASNSHYRLGYTTTGWRNDVFRLKASINVFENSIIKSLEL